MSDAKPYTMATFQKDIAHGTLDGNSIGATVRALEEAQDLYRETEERLAKERTAHDQTEARAEKAEAEVARLLVVNEKFHAEIMRLMNEVDARAEKAEARLREVAKRAYHAGWNRAVDRPYGQTMPSPGFRDADLAALLKEES